MATTTHERPKTTELKKEVKPRSYTAFKRVSGTADKIAAAVHDEIGDDTGSVLILVSTANSINPRSAMKIVGEHHDLDGDYEVSATGAFTSFPGLETAMQRGVKGL